MYYGLWEWVYQYTMLWVSMVKPNLFSGVTKKIGCNCTGIYRFVLRISNKANIFRQMNVMRIECTDV